MKAPPSSSSTDSSDDPYASLRKTPPSSGSTDSSADPYASLRVAPAAAKADTALDDGAGGKIFNPNVEPWKSAGEPTATVIPRLPPMTAAARDVTVNNPDPTASTPPGIA